MAKPQFKSYDLITQGETVRRQISSGPNPVVEARNMMSQTILTHVLLALSDCGFYQFLNGEKRFSIQTAIQALGLNSEIFISFVDYLVGCEIMERDGEDAILTVKGERVFNVYTRGVVNIYMGGYKNIFFSMSELLSGKMSLKDSSLDRSAPHAAAGTAFATCSFTIPEVLKLMASSKAKCVLDLGCGTGDFLIQLARMNAETTGFGVDMSAGALKQAKENAGAFGLETKLNFFEGVVGAERLPISVADAAKVDMVTSMYMLHEFGRDGRGAIVDVISKLRAQFSGRLFLMIEVEDADVNAGTAKALPHYGRLDYRLIHVLSRQGLPRSQQDWHAILEESGCEIINPGVKAGGSYIYLSRFR